MTNPPSSPTAPASFSSLPDEIVVNCFARISKSHYRSLSSVSKRFLALLSSPELYAARSQIGATEPRLYISLRLPTDTYNRWFTLTTTHGGEGELSLEPAKFSRSYSPARLNTTTVAVGYEIYQIGGSHKGKRSRAVRVLDCRNHTWRRAPDMAVARKRAKCCFLDGKIYVTGGCRKREENDSMKWGEFFDLKTQTWKPLLPPSDDKLYSNHKVFRFGERLYFITKHSNNYAYDPKRGRWLLEVGFVGLECMLSSGCWSVIDNVIFIDNQGKYKWYDSSSGKWRMIKGLTDLYKKRARGYQTIQLLNYGGKLVIIWHEWIPVGRRLSVRWKHQPVVHPIRPQDKRIWCAVIQLEKPSRSEILGKIERLNVILPRVPSSYNLLSCDPSPFFLFSSF